MKNKYFVLIALFAALINASCSSKSIQSGKEQKSDLHLQSAYLVYERSSFEFINEIKKSKAFNEAIKVCNSEILDFTEGRTALSKVKKTKVFKVTNNSNKKQTKTPSKEKPNNNKELSFSFRCKPKEQHQDLYKAVIDRSNNGIELYCAAESSVSLTKENIKLLKKNSSYKICEANSYIVESLNNKKEIYFIGSSGASKCQEWLETLYNKNNKLNSELEVNKHFLSQIKKDKCQS